MTALPVARYLLELSADQGATAGRGGAQGGDVEALIEEAYVRGASEARAAAGAEYETKLHRQAEAAEERLRSERARWTEEESARISAAIVKAFGDVEARISDQVARVLKPFLIEQVRMKAVAELRSALDDLLLKGSYSTISVSGPEDLVSALREQLEGSTQAIRFIATAGACDVSIAADETILETRIGAWIQAIAGGSS